MKCRGMYCIDVKDKNGKEIFEGDIIKFRYIEKVYPLNIADVANDLEMDHGERIGEIKFRNYGWVLESNGMSFSVLWAEKGEVIGQSKNNPPTP